MYSLYPSGYDRKRSDIILTIAKWGVRVPQNHFFFTFFLVKRNKTGKTDKHILTNNKITGDKPSQQLFPKLVATQLPFLA